MRKSLGIWRLLLEAKDALRKTGAKIVVVKENGDLETSRERWLWFLVKATREGRKLEGSAVGDRIVGLGAAFLLVHLGARAVFGEVMSKGGLKVLISHSVYAWAKKVVDFIEDRHKTPCPLERRLKPDMDIENAIKVILREAEVAQKSRPGVSEA